MDTQAIVVHIETGSNYAALLLGLVEKEKTPITIVIIIKTEKIKKFSIAYYFNCYLLFSLSNKQYS